MKNDRMGQPDRLDLFFRVTGLYDDVKLRREFLKHAIVYSKRCPDPSARYLQHVLASVNIDGFPKGKAPERKVIAKLCKAYRWKNYQIDLAAILELWWKANQERICEAKEALEKIEPSERLQLENEILKGELSSSFLGLVDRFKSEYSCMPDEKVEMFFCAALLENEAEGFPEGSLSMMPDEQTKAGELPERLQGYLDELGELPINAPEWDFWEEFVQQAFELKEDKLKESQHRLLLEPIFLALTCLKTEASKELEYIGKAEALDRWIPSDCDPNKVDQVVEQINQLTESLKELLVPLPSTFSNITEEEEAQQKRKELRERALKGFEILDRLFDEEGSEKPSIEIGDKKAEEPPKQPETQETEAPLPVQKDEMPSADIQAETNEQNAEEEPVEATTKDEMETPTLSAMEVSKPEPEDITSKTSETITETDENEAIEGKAETEELIFPEAKSWNPSMTCQEIASIVLHLNGDEKEQALRDLLWSELKEEQFGAAHWIAKHFESIYKNPQQIVPSWLIEYISISRHLKHSFGPLAPRLTKLAEEFTDSIFIDPEEWKNGMRFLVAGAMLRPSIIAPSSGASALLSAVRMKGDIENTYKICQAVIEFANYGHSLNPMVLGTVLNRTSWREKLNSVVEEAREWYQQAPQMGLIYQPATNVWIKWQNPNGLISQIMRPVCDNDLSRKEIVREMIEQYSDESKLKEAIHETDRTLRKSRKSSKSITGRGLSQIVSHAFGAFELARRWLTLSDKGADGDADWLMQQIDALQNIFVRHGDLALKELGALRENHSDSFCLSSGISVLEKAIAQSRKIFDANDTIESGKEIPTAFLLNHQFLLIPTIRMDEDWTPPVDSSDNIASSIIAQQAEGEMSLEEIFERYCEAGDHEKTTQILEYLKTMQQDDETDRLEERRDRSIEEHRIKLNDDLAFTRKKIGEAVAQNLLTEEEYTDLINEIDGIDTRKIFYFPEISRRLEKVRQRLKETRRTRVSAIKTKVKNSEFSEKEKASISELIDADDIGTAEEFIVMLESGESLPAIKSAVDQRFEEFFPKFIGQFEQFMLQNKTINSIIKDIKSGHRLGPVNLKGVRGAQLDEAEKPIRAWFTAKKGRNIDVKGVISILSWIGFDVQNIDTLESSKDGQVQWFKVSTKILRKCPIPDYGSAASGNYRLLCVHGRPPEDVVLDMAAQQKRNAACIALYFGRITETQLRSLAMAARNNPPGVLLIDESCIFFLLAERGSKVDSLFQVTLPFTSNNPYKPFATGNVPPEMFYGRSREKENIIDPHGSCIIYGGRQLGKSALLRSVERSFHRPSDQHYAFFVDLKTEGLGESRPVDDIWKILHTNLHNFGILQTSFDKKRASRLIVQGLVEWASAKVRRLLILLDEADVLLDEDSRDEFSRITAMKKIMDSTDRRIKFVFAGLHNVQRFTKIPNQPLAHLGAPICIGPLLNNGEWREARRLIEAPLSALGYRFDPRHLVNRILAHTNYQPSLIQLFCETLVHYLSDPNRVNFDQRTSPPYVITDKHVDNVYLNTNLRKNIKDRFELTLNLDPRYMVIAYVIAHGALEKEEDHRKGFSIRWITDEVNDWWPRGFAESSSLDDLRGLLEEMIGLGVLTKNEENRYRLRSPNVLRLLGSQKDIEHTLLDASSWELPKKYQSSIFRRGKEDQIFRSPVTGSQEADLLYLENGIRLVFGSEALGLNSLQEYLEMAKPDSPAGSSRALSSDITSMGDFESKIREFLSARKEGLNLIFVPPQTPFSEGWVEKASQKLKALRSQTAICRIFFKFDPNALWGWLKIPTEQRPEYSLNNVQTISLKRWTESTLERWLSDLSLPPNSPSQREKIMELTGGWPNLLFRFADYCINKNWNWNEALNKMTVNLMEPGENGHFLTAIGLPENTIQRQFMKSWAELGEAMTEDDLASLFDHFYPEDIGTLLSYGEVLGLCRNVGEGKWQLEQLTAKLLYVE